MLLCVAYLEGRCLARDDGPEARGVGLVIHEVVVHAVVLLPVGELPLDLNVKLVARQVAKGRRKTVDDRNADNGRGKAPAKLYRGAGAYESSRAAWQPRR